MILTIGIPTYNRGAKLESCLNNVASQITVDLQKKVSIVVADNSSTDNTVDVVNSIKKKYNGVQITYHKHETNLGYDKNVNSLFYISETEYVMPLSDDDGLESNAIIQILNHIENNRKASVFYISNNFYDYHLLKKVAVIDKFFQKVGSNKYFKNGYELFSCSDEIFGGISGICVKRSSWHKIDSSKYFDTDWIHLGVVLSIIKDSPVFVIFEPLIKYRLDNKENRWDPFVNLGIQKVLLEFKGVFPDAVRDIYFEQTHLTRLSLLALDNKKTVGQRFEIFRRMRLSYDTTKPSFWLIDVPLLFTPTYITTRLVSIYKKLKATWSV